MKFNEIGFSGRFPTSNKLHERNFVMLRPKTDHKWKKRIIIDNCIYISNVYIAVKGQFNPSSRQFHLHYAYCKYMDWAKF